MASTKRGMNDMQRAAGLQKAASRRTDQKNKGLKYRGKYAGPDQYKGVIPEGYKGKAKGKYFGKEANLGQNVRIKPALRKPIPVDDVRRTAPWRRGHDIPFDLPTNNGTLNNDMFKIPRNGSPTTSENESSDAYNYLMNRRNDDMLKKAYFNKNKMNKKKKKKLPYMGNNPAWYQGPRLPGRKYAE